MVLTKIVCTFLPFKKTHGHNTTKQCLMNMKLLIIYTPDASNQNDSSTSSDLLLGKYCIRETTHSVAFVQLSLSYPKTITFFYLFDPDVVLRDVARSSDRNSHAQKKKRRK